MDDSGKSVDLKPLRKRLEDASKKSGLRLDTIQQDYILSWLLVGIFNHPKLKSTLVFKGDTALKQVIFNSIDSFFDPRMLEHVSRTWEQWLGRLVPNLPPCELVFNGLRNKLETLFLVSQDK